MPEATPDTAWTTPDHDWLDQPYTLHSDGTLEGTKVIADDGYELPGFTGVALCAEAGKQVNLFTGRMGLSALEIKLTDMQGNVYVVKGDSSDWQPDISQPERDPLQGFDIDVTRPDGKSMPCSGFDINLTAGKAVVYAQFHSGMVKPDIHVTDATGTYGFTGESGQGFDCQMTGPDGEVIPHVQSAQFGIGPDRALLEFVQTPPKADAEDRSSVTKTIVQLPAPADHADVTETLTAFYTAKEV